MVFQMMNRYFPTRITPFQVTEVAVLQFAIVYTWFYLVCIKYAI